MHIEEQGEAAAEWPHFVVGRDQLARWVVTETHGLCGGVFRDQASALRYAEEECQVYQADFEISGEPVSLKFA